MKKLILVLAAALALAAVQLRKAASGRACAG